MPLVLPPPKAIAEAATALASSSSSSSSTSQQPEQKPKPVAELVEQSLKRTHEVFLANYAVEVPEDSPRLDSLDIVQP
jgi:hypothetical protein